MVMQNERQEYLLAEQPKGDENTTYYTLCNRNGDIIRSGEILVRIATFIEMQRKVGFREIDFC